MTSISTNIEEMQAILDGAQARVDSFLDNPKDAYQDRMDRLSGAWKGVENIEPFDRQSDVLNNKIADLQRDLDTYKGRSADDMSDPAARYLEMLRARIVNLSDEIDSFTKAKKDRQAIEIHHPESEAKPTGDAQPTADAAYQARMERTANAWKDGGSEPVANTAADLDFM